MLQFIATRYHFDSPQRSILPRQYIILDLLCCSVAPHTYIFSDMLYCYFTGIPMYIISDLIYCPVLPRQYMISYMTFCTIIQRFFFGNDVSLKFSATVYDFWYNITATVYHLIRHFVQYYRDTSRILYVIATYASICNVAATVNINCRS